MIWLLVVWQFQMLTLKFSQSNTWSLVEKRIVYYDRSYTREKPTTRLRFKQIVFGSGYSTLLGDKKYVNKY